MSRERVTITIREDLLAQVDRLVDGLIIRSRSQAIENLLSKLLSEFRVGQALILAGGKSKHAPPSGGFAPQESRFLLQLQGKPLIEQALNAIHGFHVGNFFVYVDSFNRKIVDVLSAHKLPYHVDFLLDEASKGTLAPLLKARPRMKDTFLVAYGDTISSLNLNDMLAFHKQNKALATIALTTVSNPKDYGVAMLQGGKVSEFIQKPEQEAKSYLINAGYFLFEPQIFDHLTSKMTSLENDLLPLLASKGLLYGYPFQGKYLNVNTPQDLERAEMLL